MAIAMVPLLEQLEDKPEEERPVLYACENRFAFLIKGRGRTFFLFYSFCCVFALL